MVVQKGSLLILTGGCRHLHIVMNDPVYDPISRSERVLLVNISSIKDNEPYDKTCILEPGDHPFIRHPSFVYYKEAVLSCPDKLETSIGLGDIDHHTPFDDDPYQKILEGFNHSPMVKGKITRFLKYLQSLN